MVGLISTTKIFLQRFNGVFDYFEKKKGKREKLDLTLQWREKKFAKDVYNV